MRVIKTKMDAAREILPIVNQCERTQKLSTVYKKIVKTSDCFKCYSHNNYTIPFIIQD